LIIVPYSFFFIPYSESVPIFSSPSLKFPHHRAFFALFFSTFYLLRSTGCFPHRPQFLPILIIVPYSFFFIPYSESVPTFSSTDSRFRHHRVSLSLFAKWVYYPGRAGYNRR